MDDRDAENDGISSAEKDQLFKRQSSHSVIGTAVVGDISEGIQKMYFKTRDQESLKSLESSENISQ